MSTLAPDGHVAEWFGRIMLETAEATNTKLTEAKIRVYAHDLQEFTPPQLVAAMRRCRREGKGFFPAVAEVIREIEPSPDDRAMLAWTALEAAAAQIGAYQSIEIEDAAAAEALVAVFGSWASWCEMERGPDLLTKRQQFLAAYRDARRQMPTSPAPVRCAGLLEASGRYERKPALAVGRITARGEVIAGQEAPELPAGQTVNRLTDGTR